MEPAKKPKSSTLQLEVDRIFQHGLRLERLYTNPEDAKLGMKVRVEETGDVIVLWIVAALKDEDGWNAVYIMRYIILFLVQSLGAIESVYLFACLPSFSGLASNKRSFFLLLNHIHFQSIWEMTKICNAKNNQH